MDQLQRREQEIFKALKELKNMPFAIIGGYAVNCYVLPRFSVDCDIVVKTKEDTRRICKTLEKLGYNEEAADELDVPYKGEFKRYVKDLDENFKVSFDILIGHVLDRQTKSTFSANWVFSHAHLQSLKGKTITEQLKMNVIGADALFVMKFATGRISDIRDIFMLALKMDDAPWVKEEITKRYGFSKLTKKIREKILSEEFKDNLQGVFGYVDEKLFERHKRKLLEFVEG